METLTTHTTPSFYEGNVIWLNGRRMIVESVDSATTMTIRRPILGHYIAWATLGLWRSIFRRS